MKFESPCIGCDYHNALIRGVGYMDCSAFGTTTNGILCGMRCPPFSESEKWARLLEEQKKGADVIHASAPKAEKNNESIPQQEEKSNGNQLHGQAGV